MIEWFFASIVALFFVGFVVHLLRAYRKGYGRQYIVYIEGSNSAVQVGPRIHARMVKAGIAGKTVAI